MKINKVKIFFTSIDVIEDELSKINEDSKQNARDKGVISKYSLNFEGFLALEYNPLDMKAIFWQPINKDYTMMLSNLIDGWQTLGYILNKVKGIQMLDLSLMDDYVQFNFNDDRFIRVMWDDRWDFYEFGQPLPFENTQQYKARLKKDRLTPEMVEEYANYFGVDLRDPNMYITDKEAIYFTKNSRRE